MPEIHINPEVIFILLALIGSAIKTVMDRRAAARRLEEGEDDRHDVYDEYREAILEQQRRYYGFVEEEEEIAPPPLPPAPAPAPVLVVTPPAPSPYELPKSRSATPRLSAAEEAALANLEKRSTHAPRTASAHQRASKKSQSATHQALALLSTPQAAQQAIILTEILGPPKSMREF